MSTRPVGMALAARIDDLAQRTAQPCTRRRSRMAMVIGCQTDLHEGLIGTKGS